MSSKTLIFIPTYNERENAREMFEQIGALGLDADVLFVDDNSPDGTGAVLDELARTQERLHVVHRSGKLGIGSAHREGILWAYDHGYTRLITMDCDFTHSPTDIRRLLERAADHDVVVGSRYLEKASLPGWNLFRKSLTRFGHLLTKRLLGIPYDATGAFRVYDLRTIPRELFLRVTSPGYAFLFESLFLIGRNGWSVAEVPIVLPARTYGHSKMSMREAARSAARVLGLYGAAKLNPGQFQVTGPYAEIDPTLVNPQNWDGYWAKKREAPRLLYDLVATLYRNVIIKRRLNDVVRRNFPRGSALLHAGCGSGHVDSDIQYEMEITAVDISVAALEAYCRNNPGARAIRHASVFDLPFADGSFDGAYSLGLVEHFTEPEIRRMFAETRRVLRAGGKMIIFWPHRRASSVLVLRAVHWVLNDLLHKDVQLYPPEISLLKSRSAVEPLLREAGFDLIDYYFGAKDLFVQAVLVAAKR